MIEETFLHCFGIGPVNQKKLYQAGFTDWESVLKAPPNALPIRKGLLSSLYQSLILSKKALNESNIQYLIDLFPLSERWRILKRFIGYASYFDIETTGLSTYECEVTVITCLHQDRMHHFIKGENLDEFLNLLGNVKLMVSFNGCSFDIPRILDLYRIPNFPCPHLDLRWLCHRLGYHGGLKAISKSMGIAKDPLVGDINGLEAIRLWERWQQNDIKAKELLIRYCSSDTKLLKSIATKIIALYSEAVMSLMVTPTT